MIDLLSRTIGAATVLRPFFSVPAVFFGKEVRSKLFDETRTLDGILLSLGQIKVECKVDRICRCRKKGRTGSCNLYLSQGGTVNSTVNADTNTGGFPEFAAEQRAGEYKLILSKSVPGIREFQGSIVLMSNFHLREKYKNNWR